MAEPSFSDPSPFANFPQFDASDLSFDDPDLFPDCGFPSPEGITADFDLDDIDLDFSVDDLLLPSADGGNNGSSSNSNSNITANSDPNPGSNPGSPESGNSSGASGAATSHQDVKQEENSSRFKRKIDDNGVVEDPSPGPDSNPSSRNLKIQRSGEGNSPWSVAAGTEEDEKRRARLMRNRESAQLSRQRKKQYVEELEEKVKLMNSTIADLNGKISFYMTENARLHQQLSGNGANGKGNPPPPPPQYYFPWIPYGGYPTRHNGPPVPYVPIPRLKPQQPVSAPKVKKTERKKSESKTKKVASVSLLGLFFVMMVFGGVRNFGLGGNKDKVYYRFGGSHGRVLTVEDRGNSLNNTQEFGQFSGKMGCGVRGRQNSSESLPALLYVPRNGKHVEINGNLIIHSVLASERATAQTKSRGQEKQLSVKEGTGLMIPVHVASALAIREGAMGVGTHSRAYRNSAEYPRALGSGSHDAYRDNIKSTLADGPLQQWFREGLAGPPLSSGTCTEVFQFEVSPSSINPSGIIPATSAVNSTDKLPPGKIKNRRIMYSQPIPLNGSALGTTESNNTVHGSKNTIPSSSSSMVVSVLADPREAGDGDSDGVIRPKSISRIFVVVLLDSVKYVTYSCMLPLKNHGPHLVN